MKMRQTENQELIVTRGTRETSEILETSLNLQQNP